MITVLYNLNLPGYPESLNFLRNVSAVIPVSLEKNREKLQQLMAVF